MMRLVHRHMFLASAYLYAVAAEGGFNVCDRLSVTRAFTFCEIGQYERGLSESGYCIDVRVEIASHSRVTPTHIHHDIPVLLYNLMRTPRHPRLLFLLLPGDEQGWLDHSEERLEMRCCGYWLSLRGMPATTNKRTVRIAVPRANVLSVSTLNRILVRWRAGELM